MGFDFRDIVEEVVSSVGNTSGIGLLTGGKGIGDFSASSVWNSYTGKEQAREANDANIASAREAMAFSERMSSTAHQRQMADLKMAGLNPSLSPSLGGASAPSGVKAEISPVPSSSRAAVSSGVDAANFIREQKSGYANIAEAVSRADMNAASARHLDAQTNMIEADIPPKKNISNIYKKYPRATGWIDYGLEKLGSLSNSAMSLGIPYSILRLLGSKGSVPRKDYGRDIKERIFKKVIRKRY